MIKRVGPIEFILDRISSSILQKFTYHRVSNSNILVGIFMMKVVFLALIIFF